MLLAADTLTPLLLGGIPGLLALAGTLVMATTQVRATREKKLLEIATSQASHKADTTEAAFNAYSKMVDANERQLADLRTQLINVQASADRCHEDRLRLLERVGQLERESSGRGER